jgi:hypothetical protein
MPVWGFAVAGGPQKETLSMIRITRTTRIGLAAVGLIFIMGGVVRTVQPTAKFLRGAPSPGLTLLSFRRTFPMFRFSRLMRPGWTRSF